LPRHSRLFPCDRQYAKTDINVRNQKPPRTNFKLTAILKCIETTKDYITGSKRRRLVLPPHAFCNYDSIALKTLNQAASNVNLSSLLARVFKRGSNKPIQIRLFHEIRIVKHEVSKADMSKLLNNMRSTTAKSDDPHARTSDDRLRILPKKRLSTMACVLVHDLGPNRIGNPTIATREGVGPIVSGSQMRAVALSRLSTSPPCATFGATTRSELASLSIVRQSTLLKAVCP
jgi:hypothetical protein